jgi:hypothetical protein
MHLMVTAASDSTSDWICHRLGPEVLRLNWERWEDYEVALSSRAFRIADRYGRCVTNANLGNIIWRKPVNDVDRLPGEHWFGFQEFKYVIESILQQVRLFAPHKLKIDPHRNRQVDKVRQLLVAEKHMRVPHWRVTSLPSAAGWEGSWVIKSMTGKPIPSGTGDFSPVIYTSRVDPAELADGYPWFVQEAIEARYDLTIVVVGKRQFAFTLDRELFSGVDWRASIGNPEVDSAWRSVQLPAQLSDSTRWIMSELELPFGRIDLLVSNLKCDDPVFLEVNPNGQWAWLDPKRDNGLFDEVIRFLTS